MLFLSWKSMGVDIVAPSPLECVLVFQTFISFLRHGAWSTEKNLHKAESGHNTESKSDPQHRRSEVRSATISPIRCQICLNMGNQMSDPPEIRSNQRLEIISKDLTFQLMRSPTIWNINLMRMIIVMTMPSKWIERDVELVKRVELVSWVTEAMISIVVIIVSVVT